VKASAKGVSPHCVICATRSTVERHHVGGRKHLVWLTAPLCRIHHNRLHRLLKTAGVDLEYTGDPVERLIRATKAISIFMCMVQDALHEARLLETNN
jgi:hypothetical protein